MDAYCQPALSPEERAEDLLSRMTLREKIGQLNQRLYGFNAYTRRGDAVDLSPEFCEEVARWGGLGALYGLHRADPWSGKNFETGLTGTLAVSVRNRIQRYVIEHSRFGIPVLFTTECPHGPQSLEGYVLPVNLASGASFAPELLEKAAEICGQQLRDMGVDVALVSALDILRDPRWGRSEECFGEDPYLAADMARAVVQGIQRQGVDVVAKHLCAQGETTGGVNASAARIGLRELREIHLPPVKACVEAGTAGFMAAYNEIDGIYCHANRWLLTDLLRGEYGFQGFVMSDGEAIDQLDAVTGDRTASGALALNAGVDMGLWDTGFGRLEDAVSQGLVDVRRIDEAAKRILTLKFRKGLFEQPYVPETEAWRGYTPEKYPAVKTLAEHSVVLLKNRDGLLPLSKDRLLPFSGNGLPPLSKKAPLALGLTGPNADALYHQLGDYTPPVQTGQMGGTTLREGLAKLLGADSFVFQPGGSLFEIDEPAITAAVAAMADCDVVIVALGGSSSRFAGGIFQTNGAAKKQDTPTMDCGENVDAGSLRLPGGQLELLRRLKAAGKKTVAVVIAGRPYETAELDPYADALVWSFYPGLTGGEAIARLLFGLCEPAGRLNATLPDTVGQLPVYYNSKDSYRAGRYYDIDTPRYRFGSGLSYTRFGYELLREPEENCLELAFRVKNTGSRTGWAVPQLYLHRTQGIATSRIRQLCGFEKISLAPGESRELAISVPQESLEQWDSAMQPRRTAGMIEWFLCDGGQALLSGCFMLRHSGL